jgi:hypothetical protein
MSKKSLNKLTIYYNRAGLFQALLVLLILETCILTLLPSQNIFIFKLLSIVFISIAQMAIIIILFDQKPVAHIMSTGIYFKRFGFISWGDIAEIKLYTIKTTPVTTIGINLKNRDFVYKQASRAGKIELFWAKLCHYPHIKLSCLELNNEEIITFIKQKISPKDNCLI